MIRSYLKLISKSIRGFVLDDCYMKASALTYYTLLSIVPVLAVLFGIAKGFGFEKALEFEIHQKFSEQQELIQTLIQFAYSWLATVQGGVIAGIGAITLLWTVFGLFNNTESALNSIWKISCPRSYSRKIGDYLAAMVIAPLFLITSSSITLFLNTKLQENTNHNLFVEAMNPLILVTLKFFPYLLIWTLFSFVYIFIPNTKVSIRSGLIAGVSAGTIFQCWQWIYIKFQMYASSYGAIYGSFAALPLFLIWMQVSWLILLAGAELAFELDNENILTDKKFTSISSKGLALLITYQTIEAFVSEKDPVTLKSLSRLYGLSMSQIHPIIEALINSKIIATVVMEGNSTGYQPARDVNSITMKKVCDAIETSHHLMATLDQAPEVEFIRTYFLNIDRTLEDSKINPPVYMKRHA